MADLVLGLAKTTVEGTVTMARSAMEEEAKLQKSVQRDLLVISDEFEMMHSFLNDVKDRVTDNVTNTLVRQMLPWCMPAASPAKDLDAAVANIEQLKARVEAMGQRNLRYNRVGDSSHKPVEQMHKQAVATAMAPNLFVTATDAAKQSGRVDLVMLINRKNTNESRQGKIGAEGGQARHMLVFGIGSDMEVMSIKKAYDDTETCKSFKYRAWVKLVHPFHPIEFIRSLLSQFYKNICPKQDNTDDALKVLVVSDNALIMDFMSKIRDKYLVVLEDVSTMVDWEAVRGYLPDKKNGSCIVVHTRQFGMACSCIGHGYRVLELEKLSAGHSIRVLFKEVCCTLES
ncbi:hypothetical protein HU200_048839 [Digitaria exilis]|uniref:NB-ARC domain-containing protein n=1 Tax=Digitaria exilis TaxID=1010633 RepID=A0A835ECL2_9POAL|nr:hypothetical protein HU200_048839 [Digitaria exilis]